MNSKFKVLITDPYHQNFHIEKEILAEINAVVKVGHCKTEEDVIRLGSEMDGLLVSYIPIGKKVIENLHKCKVIVKYAVGADNIDLKAATLKKIFVANVPRYCVEEVSTHTVALLLNLIRKISKYDQSVKRGFWDSLVGNPIFRLENRVLGIIGFGNIGKRVVEKIRPFGLSILVYDPAIIEKTISKYGGKKVDLNTLLNQSDYISLHCPLNKYTKHLIDFKEIEIMKKGVFIINTSRGEIINLKALYKAIKDEKIAGAALDVLEKDPPSLIDIINTDNIIYTPHVAWNSVEAETELRKSAAQEVKRVLEGGRPLNLVNKDITLPY
ncbi:MAG: C-terminal binding protein [Candidatus Atribacteria bacterium]|nr:C-terminal binding protein [Candidatus Atribacteria bacterium]